MVVYTQHIQRGQDTLDVAAPWNPLDYGVEISTRNEVREFLDHIPEPPTVTEARFNIIRAYESGAMGAVEALNALDAYGCLADADDFMLYFISGYYARSGLPVETPHVALAAAKAAPATQYPSETIQALAGVRALSQETR